MIDDDAIPMPGGGHLTHAQAMRIREDAPRAADGAMGVRIPGLPVEEMVAHVTSTCGAVDDSQH